VEGRVVNDETTTFNDDTAELRDLMSAGAAELRALVSSQPTTEEEVVAVLSRRLEGPVTPETWDSIRDSLTSYLGEEAFNTFGFTMTSDVGDETRLHILEEVGGPDVVNVLRRIMAQFGEELRLAYEVSGQLADNWRLVNREVYRDLINNRYFMRIEVEKYGGEKTAIEGPPDSILSLATFLLGALRYTGDADAFSEVRIDAFLTEARELISLLTAAEEIEVEEDGSNDGDPSR
jgi:hypothetical protein